MKAGKPMKSKVKLEWTRMKFRIRRQPTTLVLYNNIWYVLLKYWNGLLRLAIEWGESFYAPRKFYPEFCS